MNIYLVYRTDDVQYDEYDSIVVYAKNKKDALKLIPGYGIETWAFSRNLGVTALGSNVLIKEPEIILASFNAG